MKVAAWIFAFCMLTITTFGVCFLTLQSRGGVQRAEPLAMAMQAQVDKLWSTTTA